MAAVTTSTTRGKVPMTGIGQTKVFGLLVDREFMFSDHKERYKPRVEKRQRKLITQISFIRPFLEPGETILLVTTGHSPPTVLEKLGIGWLFLYLKRSLLIFTDRRIFHVPTTSTYRYRNSITQIPYASCGSILIKRASLVVEYRDGKETEKFPCLSGREKKKIRELLKIISFEGPQRGVFRRVHLCPQCAKSLYSSISSCGACGLKFKTGTVATWLAILLPGGGYFYLRQPFLGVASALLEITAVVLIATSVGNLPDALLSNLLWLGLGVLMLGLIKPVAVVHARVIAGEFIPRPAEVTFQAAAASNG
jgi:hypothetical protein